MVEAGGISEGGQASAAEDIILWQWRRWGGGEDGGGGWEGAAHANSYKRQNKMRMCVSYFVSVFTFLVRATMITRTGYFAHTYSLQMLNTHKTKRGKGMHPEQNERGSDSSGPIL